MCRIVHGRTWEFAISSSGHQRAVSCFGSRGDPTPLDAGLLACSTVDCGGEPSAHYTRQHLVDWRYGVGLVMDKVVRRLKLKTTDFDADKFMWASSTSCLSQAASPTCHFALFSSTTSN